MKLQDLKIVNELLKIFVDDVNGIFHPIDPGLEYMNGRLEWNAEKAVDDADVPKDIGTMRIVQAIANDIEPMIQMTFDVPSLHNDKKVPMLDTKVWIDEEENKIYHQYFEKPTKSKMVISKESAMPLHKKIDILSNEVFKRLHNTSHDIEWEKKVPMLEKFMAELKISGYSENDRAEILNSGIRTY